MRLGFEWIPKEEQNVDAGLRDSCTDLLIAAKWSAAHAFKGQASVVGNQLARRASGNKSVIF